MDASLLGQVEHTDTGEIKELLADHQINVVTDPCIRFLIMQPPCESEIIICLNENANLAKNLTFGSLWF